MLIKEHFDLVSAAVQKVIPNEGNRKVQTSLYYDQTIMAEWYWSAPEMIALVDLISIQELLPDFNVIVGTTRDQDDATLAIFFNLKS